LDGLTEVEATIVEGGGSSLTAKYAAFLGQSSKTEQPQTKVSRQAVMPYQPRLSSAI
jgi:hypothetical protein